MSNATGAHGSAPMLWPMTPPPSGHLPSFAREEGKIPYRNPVDSHGMAATATSPTSDWCSWLRTDAVAHDPSAPSGHLPALARREDKGSLLQKPGRQPRNGGDRHQPDQQRAEIGPDPPHAGIG
jgi:hypothetical protein